MRRMDRISAIIVALQLVEHLCIAMLVAMIVNMRFCIEKQTIKDSSLFHNYVFL